MKPKLFLLAFLVALPALLFSQSFNVNKALGKTNDQLFAKELYSHSVILQTLAVAMEGHASISEDDAKLLVEEKLRSLNDPALTERYAQVSPEDIIKIGLILYLTMGAASNLPDPYKGNLAFGTGFGVFLMYTLSNFVLMPELLFMWQGFGEKYNDSKATTRFAQIALSLTMLYIIHAQTIRFVVGLSPQFFYSFSGKITQDDEPDEDVEFDGEYGANRFTTFIGLSFGVMLQNDFMIRAMYSLGLTKMYKGQDPKMYYLALILSMPLWSLK